MSKLILPKLVKTAPIKYRSQYERWIEYLTYYKYKPTFKNLAATGFDHPELTKLKESLHQLGYTQKEIDDYKLTESNLIRMDVTETELRYRFLDESERIRLGFAKSFYDLESEGYSLYHLTLTYKPQPHELSTERVDSCFVKFHTQFLLPKSLGTRNIHHQKFRQLQPIAYAFLDEHDPEKSKFINSQTSIRLHHHAVYAVHPDAKEWFDEHIGQDTFSVLWKDFSPYLTSDLKPCEPMRVLYASKMLKTYPEFQMFPDKWKRTYEKYPNITSSPCQRKIKDAAELFRNFKPRNFPWQKKCDSYTPLLEAFE
jgi:hypothetical protein